MKKTLLLLPLVLLASCAPSTPSSSEGNSNSEQGFENNKLVIGLECAYPPFNWSDRQSEYTLPIANKANKHADGYDIQIAKILGNKLGIEVEIHQIVWEDLILSLQMGVINAVVAGMTDTEERRMSIDFTDEYYRSELVLIVPSAVASAYNEALSEAQFADFINGKIVVSQSSTVTNDVIDTFANEYGAIHANPVDTFALAAQDVVNGSADAMTAELPVARSIVASLPNLGIIHIDQSILGAAQAELGVSIGIAKGNTELCTKLNNALAEISTDERNTLMEEAVIRSSN